MVYDVHLLTVQKRVPYLHQNVCRALVKMLTGSTSSPIITGIVKHVSTSATVELHRLEWYDGLGAFAIERSRRLAPGWRPVQRMLPDLVRATSIDKWRSSLTA